MNVTSENTDPSHGDKNGTPPAHGANSGSHGDQSPPTVTLEDLQKQFAELQAKHAEILADNQKYRKEAAKAKEEQDLREQNQFKELAEKYGAKVQELEPTVERYTALSGLLDGQIKAQVKDWPKEVKDLLPDDSVSIEDRYAQVQKLQAFVDKLQAAPTTKPGHAPNPKPATQTPEGYQKKLEDQLRASGKYRA